MPDPATGPERVEEVGRAWSVAATRLPAGWTLEGLRCASTGIEPASRSDDWVAVAVGPGGTERTYRASDPIGALEGLAGSLGARTLEER